MKLSNKRFQTRTLRVLFHLLPQRMKRLMFISSLSGKVAGTNEFDRVVLLQIQEEFKLTKVDPHAMELPVACANKIWGKRPVEDLVCSDHLNEKSDHDMTRIARQIVVMMPCWLVYDSTFKIANDVRELLTKREQLFQHQPG
uniref:Uncharacterized protein n=1 Tax=Burkholderia phage vB_BgluM-SURPRISE13 TaxID=3159457 RepID=A0AAU7PFU7_9VIRU